jgi:hypothetical protein
MVDITLNITVRALHTNLHPYDVGVPGNYQTSVSLDLHASDAAETALEAFHRQSPIKMLEDFEITVTDMMGNVLAPSGNRELEFETNNIVRVHQ